jgi:small subunit ribosomal protein S3
MRLGALGVKMQVSGRLNGSRNRPFGVVRAKGRVPLHTFRADIDYGTRRSDAPPTV